MESIKDLSYLIESIASLEEFWIANYYIRSMKKAPHGGVMHIRQPNCFLLHYPFMVWSFVSESGDTIPFFMQSLVQKAVGIYHSCDQIDLEELLQFCFNDDQSWYTGYRLLKAKPDKKAFVDSHPEIILFGAGDAKCISDYYDISPQIVIYGLILKLIQDKYIVIPSTGIITKHECLREPYNKYGLTKIANAMFLREGFVLENYYYIYNIFLDTSIGNPSAKMPITLELIDEIKNKEFYMRCDNNLSVPFDKMFSTATVDFQVFHGITLDFCSIEAILSKEIIVHIDPESYNKILVVVKRDHEGDNAFYHIEVEELWEPSRITDSIIMATFIHAKYFPSKAAFTHIDYSVNEYSADIYRAKYTEAVNDTHIPVDKYCDLHYKIWCVEADSISVKTWSHLVCATLDEPFREIFLETFRE